MSQHLKSALIGFSCTLEADVCFSELVSGGAVVTGHHAHRHRDAKESDAFL